MKGFLKFLIGLVLGATLGWALGFLRFPSIEKNDSFWAGFGVCLAVVVFLVAFRWVWNKDGLRRKQGTQDTAAVQRPVAWLGLLVGVALVLVATGIGWYIHRQNRLLDAQIESQAQENQQKADLADAVRNSNQVQLMARLLEKIEAESQGHPAGTLSEPTIAQIAALSYTFRPYHYLGEWISPERGQLLLSLAVMDIDSASFVQIKQRSSFALSDLRGANLQGADLRGADLTKANFRGADLRSAKLDSANLRHASLWGANLQGSSLQKAQLGKANLNWAVLNGAVLDSANLNGADLSNAQLLHTDLSGATLRFGKAESTLFQLANLTGVDMLGAKLAKANLNQANLTGAHFRWVDLTDAHLDHADLTQLRVSFDTWEKIWGEWHLTDAQEMQQQYKIVSDTLHSWGASFLLQKN